MQDHYSLLHTIYEIVKNDPQPERYSCKPRELILRRMQEWSDIQQQLQQLEKEGFVTTEQQETMVIRITNAGLSLVKEQLEVARLSGN
jgi:DNA-binding MarR family transcriptional regulator